MEGSEALYLVAAAVLAVIALFSVALNIWMAVSRKAGRSRRDGQRAPELSKSGQSSETKPISSALGDSIESLGAYSDSASQWLWETGPDMRFSYVSQDWDKNSRLRREEILGRRREELSAFDPTDEKWSAFLADLEAHRPFRSFIYSIRQADGSLQHYSTSGEPRFDEDGVFLGYRGAGGNITQAMNFEKQLRGAEARLQAVMDHAPFMIVVKDAEGRYLEVNRHWEDRYGLTNEEVAGKSIRQIREAITGRPVHEIFDSDMAAGMGRLDRTVLTEGKTLVMEESLPEPDGTNRIFLTTRFPVRDSEGTVTGLVFIGTDITERKAAEAALRENMRTVELLRHIATAANGAVDVEQAMQVCLDEVCAFTGWPAGHAFRLAGDGTEDVIAAGIWHLDDAEHFRAFREATVGIRFAPGVGLPGRVLASGESAWITDVTADPDYSRSAVARDVGIGAAFAFPVLIGRDIAAVLEFYDREPHEPNQDLIGIMAQIGAMLGRVIERQQAEHALRASEAQLRTVADNLPVSIAYYDMEERFLFVNEMIAKRYERPVSELVGTRLDELVTAEAYAKFRPRIELVLAGQDVHFEETIVLPNDQIQVLDAVYIPDFDEDGKPRGWFALLQDITERKKTERALRDSEEQLRTVADNLPVSIAYFDKDERFLFANKMVGKRYARPTSEIIGMRFGELLTAETYAKVRPRIEAVMSGQDVRFEETINLPDGQRREIDATYIPDIGEDGKPRGWFALAHDITERKKTEQALRESEEQLRTVADNLPVSITYFDMDQRFLFANKAFCKRYGRPASEILGMRLADLLLAETYAKVRPRIEAVMAGQEIRFEETVENPDGVIEDVDAIYIPDFGEDGKPRGWFALVQDITESKRLQAELLRNARLAAMGQLTGTVAHELRNPLGAIASTVTVIRHKTGEANLDLGKSLDRVERSIRRCDNIITELLDFARAKGLQPRPAVLDAWLSEVVAEQTIPAGITVRCKFQTAGAVVNFDPEDLRRAVINLIDNACQAMAGGDGAGRLAISTRGTGERIEIILADTGPGIPPDDLPRVMEPLYSTKAFGTGLGLPTVQRIMEEHGGGMELGSNNGKGTRVLLWLPATRDTVAEQRGLAAQDDAR